MVSTGTSDADFEKTKQILALHSQLNFVCIDVANGYSEHFVQFVSKAREAWPNKTICAGNVVTGEMCEELISPVRILSKWVSARVLYVPLV
jgi:GMP reductase